MIFFLYILCTVFGIHSLALSTLVIIRGGADCYTHVVLKFSSSGAHLILLPVLAPISRDKTGTRVLFLSPIPYIFFKYHTAWTLDGELSSFSIGLSLSFPRSIYVKCCICAYLHLSSGILPIFALIKKMSKSHLLSSHLVTVLSPFLPI